MMTGSIKQGSAAQALCAAVLLIALLSGAAAGYQMSERSYQAVSACYTDDLIEGYGNVPVYHRNGTVLTTGVIEGLPDEKALGDWRYGMGRIVDDTRPEMQAYSFPDGPVISCGYDLLGTICVGIWEEADTTRRTRGDIYAVIDAAARQRGIRDVTVIFIAEPICDTKPLPWIDPDETPILPPLHEIANGYPGAQAYTQNTPERQFPSGITHSSVSSLISCLSPEEKNSLLTAKPPRIPGEYSLQQSHH
ncbi:hypothetical protein L1S32_06390 [Methanogenium sp. S4BF]|uniref:hypothetical protein n=1 Tax=Methanogenium sp. S4BF TaxID=1789226 RepID=UPI002417D105|nr:hypothetical protein [Methanogenium sp. S4BF]WFN33486.1 hypothetical protein L1S32_06390 [Methanogenium sp. S4BF]